MQISTKEDKCMCVRKNYNNCGMGISGIRKSPHDIVLLLKK